MAPRAVSLFEGKELPLPVSALDELVIDCLTGVCAGKCLEASLVSTRLASVVYKGLQSIPSELLPKDGINTSLVKQYLNDSIDYFCETFGVEDCEEFRLNLGLSLYPILVSSDVVADKPSESELREIRHVKINATKFLAYDPRSFFSPTFPQSFAKLYNPDTSVESTSLPVPSLREESGVDPLYIRSGVSTTSTTPVIDGLIPTFDEVDGPITAQQRRQARKSAKDVDLLEGGVYTGKADTRSIRRVLVYIRDVAMEESFTALEYRELLKRQISQSARASIHPRKVTTQAALVKELQREVLGLLSTFGMGDSGKLDSWKSLLFLSQGDNEKVASFAQRFDNAYTNAVCLGNAIDDSQAALQFASALNKQWSSSGATLIAAGVTSLSDLTSRLVSEERLFRRSTNVKNLVIGVSGGNDKASLPKATQDVQGRSCYYCHQVGHLKADCPLLRAKEEKNGSLVKPSQPKVQTKDANSKASTTAVVGTVPGDIQDSSALDPPSTRVVSLCAANADLHACASVNHEALFDTGSTRNLICKPLVDTLVLEGIDLKIDSSVTEVLKLADGSLVISLGTVLLSLCVDNVHCPLSFVVVETLSPNLIVGWDGMCALGTILNVQQKKIICSGGVSQAVDGDPTDPPSLAKFGGELNGPLRCAESVDLHRDPLDEVIISDSFWYHLPSAPSYRIRVRRLRDDEFKDTEEQLFVFELDLKGAIKPTPNSPQSPNYSEKLLSRLSEDDRALFYREVDGYLSRGWWLPEDQAERDDELNIPAITVFPVKSAKVGASTPIRPCCDARRFNAAAEPAGYLGADIASLTSRLLGAYSVGDSVFMLDCSRAFYRIRTNLSLPLQVGSSQFWSDRVIFGVSCGPASLEFAMLFLLRYVASLDPTLSVVRFDVTSGCHKVAKTWVYLDDVTLMGPLPELQRFYDLYLKTSVKFGLSFPTAKQSRLIPSQVCSPVTHLGSFWSIKNNHLQCSCRKDVEGFRELYSKRSKSKRDYFALAGKLVDYPNSHPRARLASDLIRSIIGSFQTPWDERVQLGEGEARQIATLLDVLRQEIETPCSHSSGSGNVAILECDASNVGFGYIFSCGLYHASRAKAFRSNQLAWHVNRKEAWCMIQGLLSCLPFLEEYCSVLSCPLTLKVVGDSKSALAWARDNRINVRSVERLAIRRMLNTLDDIRAIFDRMNVRLEFVKVPGSANSGADSLSRLPIEWKVLPIHEGSQQSLTSSSAALALVAAVNQTDDSTLKNGAQEVCQSLINGDSSAVVKWLLSLQSNDPFIDGIKKLLAKEKKDVYLERLLKDQGRLYQLNRLGLVVECKFLDEPNSVARFRVLLPGDPEILSKFARYYHETNSHCSLRYVTYLFTRDFHAPNFKQVARSVIRGCAPCVEKRVKLASSGGLQSYGRSTSDLSGVWSTVYADTADMLIKDRFGFRYLLVVVDSLCGFCWLSPLKSLDAPELVRMITSFCDRIGWPRKFISDGGRNFVAKLTKDMFRTQGVIQEFVPRYSAFANGRAERCIGSVKAKFQTLTRSQKKEWSVHIPAINKSINLSPLPTGLTAFDIFFQRSYDSPLSRKIHSVNDLVLDKELKAEEVVSRTPPKSFKVGDLVRRSNKEANDNSVYEVISVNNRSVDVRRKGDNTSLPVKEHVRNLVLAQS